MRKGTLELGLGETFGVPKAESNTAADGRDVHVAPTITLSP